MLQAPRHSRYRKCHKMRIRPISYSKGSGKLILGNTGLKALKNGRLFFKQIEASRRIISRKIKKTSRI
jgi:large subunit ribosomal protein L16